MGNQPQILALISDLFFISRAETAAHQAGYSVKSLDSYRTVSEFLELLRTNPPALIVLDLNSALPWAEWLPAAKSDPLTGAVPWLAFGSHMNPKRLAAARRAGADRVVPKSQFTEELNEIIGQMSKS